MVKLENLCKIIKRLDNNTDPSSLPSTPSYSYDRLNGNTDLNTTVVLPLHFDTSMKPQCKSASDFSMGENDLASSGFDKITNHHGNMDDMIMMISIHMRHFGGNCHSYYFGDKISTTTIE